MPLDKNTEEYWNEVSRLSELLHQWDKQRDSNEIAREVMRAMQNLGLIVPIAE